MHSTLCNCHNTMGVEGRTWAMVPKHHFHKLPVLQKGRIAVEWTWWGKRNTNNNIMFMW